MYQNHQGQLRPGWSRITKEGTTNGTGPGLSDQFLQEQVGYRPYYNYNSDLYPQRNFRGQYQGRPNSHKNMFHKNIPKNRLHSYSNYLGNKVLKGGFLNQNPNQSAFPKETETQNIINSIKNDPTKKLCIDIVSLLRKIEQDNDTIQKLDQYFAKSEDSILKTISELQTRAEIEPKVLKMITINRLLFSDLRHSTGAAANARLPKSVQSVRLMIFEVKAQTEDETIIKLLKAQARAIGVDIPILLDWLEISSLDELKNTEQLDELDRRHARKLAMTKPLTIAETRDIENFLNGELTEHGREHGLLAPDPNTVQNSPPREMAVQTSQQRSTSPIITARSTSETIDAAQDEVFEVSDDDVNLVNGNRLQLCTQLSSITTNFNSSSNSPMVLRNGATKTNAASTSSASDAPKKKCTAEEFINRVWDNSKGTCKKCNKPCERKDMIQHFRSVHEDLCNKLSTSFL